MRPAWKSRLNLRKPGVLDPFHASQTSRSCLWSSRDVIGTGWRPWKNLVLMRDFSGDHLVLGRARARRVEQRSVRTSTGWPWIPRCQGLRSDDPLDSRLLFSSTRRRDSTEARGYRQRDDQGGHTHSAHTQVPYMVSQSPTDPRMVSDLTRTLHARHVRHIRYVRYIR